MKNIKVDFAGFDPVYWVNKTEKEFVEANFGAVPEHVGDKAAKEAWLKQAYAKVTAANDESKATTK